MTKDTITVFCAADQKDTEYSLDIDSTGELVLTCTNNTGTDDAPVICGRFIKLPAGTTPDEMAEYIAKHKESNEGQVTQAAIDAQKQLFLQEMGV